MISAVKKRYGRLEKFAPEKITWAIFKAANAVGGNDFEKTESSCHKVIDQLEKKYQNQNPDIETIQNIVEKVLTEDGHAQTTKAYAFVPWSDCKLHLYNTGRNSRRSGMVNIHRHYCNNF